jgi:hypothetical protein
MDVRLDRFSMVVRFAKASWREEADMPNEKRVNRAALGRVS